MYKHIEELLSREPVTLRVWCDADGYFIGDIEVDDVAFINADSAFTLNDLLTSMDAQAGAYLAAQNK